VLDEGADATVIGNSFEQMNFSTVQAAGENRIIIASGVPGIVIGSKEGLMAATYSNYEQAMRRFADVTMRPLWRSVCACLSKLVAVPARFASVVRHVGHCRAAAGREGTRRHDARPS
jgi:phage portal protein BeeE